MYDPTIGRWLSEDPIGFEAADPNLYRYVRNNPTNFTDPTGLEVSIAGKPYSNTEEGRAALRAFLSDRSFFPTQIARDRASIIVNQLIDSASQFNYRSIIQFQNDVRVRFRITVRAEYLDNRRFGFVRQENTLIAVEPGESQYWRNVTRDIEGIEVRGLGLRGFFPNEARAIMEIFTRRNDERKPWLRFDCNQAYWLAVYGAFVDVLGEERFNETFSNLQLFGGFRTTNRGMDFAQFQNRRDFIVGDRINFLNPDGTDGFTNENAIYLGMRNGQMTFYAHPFGIGTRDQILQWLRDNRVEGARLEPYMNPRPAHLLYDRLPER